MSNCPDALRCRGPIAGPVAGPTVGVIPEGMAVMAVTALLMLSSGAVLAQTIGAAQPGLGRPATLKELAAWDIDVRPDFKGLPKGKGTVAQGQAVWESKCASCHGVFGEANEVFTPLVGGTTADDVKTGHVARLTDRSYPGRTTLMKVATVSTLWDYINRAMPWTAPKSLQTDEVYAVTAYLLNLGGVLPDDFELSELTIAQAQARMPNRNGMTQDHALWPGKGLKAPNLKASSKPDVTAVACMSNCTTEPKVASLLPDFARNNHGNLAEQNRAVGAQHGVDTTGPASVAPAAAVTAVTAITAVAATAATPSAPVKPVGMAAVATLLQKNNCTACHAVDSKLVGPAFRAIASKYGDRADGVTYLVGKVQAGGVGVWGQIPMPTQTLTEAQARSIAQWLIDGAKK
jgi:cytochrome c551/c552